MSERLAELKLNTGANIDSYWSVKDNTNSSLFMKNNFYIHEGNNLISSYSSYNPVQLGWRSYPSVNTIVELSDSVFNYSFLLCQGVYKADRGSGYNTTLIYPVTKDIVSRGLTLQGLMRDRNSNYTCNYVLIDDRHAKVVTQGGQGSLYICGIAL